mgnify:FL=1
MKLLCYLSIILFFFGSCRLPELKPENEKEIIEDIDPFEMNDAQFSLKSSMVAWEFLKKNPSEGEILKYFGDPDSSWTDEYDNLKILYYYIPEYQDYNFIEINLESGNASGFEWD